MENRDFFDTITEYIKEESGWSRTSFNVWAERCGYSEECLDEYSDEVEYKRILLSYYLHSRLYADELDFDGKPFGRPGSDEPLYRLEDVMERRESVWKYRERGMTFGHYRELVERYNLAT